VSSVRRQKWVWQLAALIGVPFCVGLLLGWLIWS